MKFLILSSLVVWAVMVGLSRLTAGWAVEGMAGSGVFRKN